MKFRHILGGLLLALTATFAYSASLVVLPRQLVVDANGEVRSGAKLYVYSANSTTPITVYQTSDLNPLSVHTSPVLSISSGLFPAMYVDPSDAPYKVVLKDSNNITIYTEDDIPVASTEPSYAITEAEEDADVTIARYSYPPGHLKRYTSNDGDGSTDVAEAFTDMLNSGEKLCILDTPETSWVIDSTVTWVTGVTVLGGRDAVIKSTVGSGNWTFVFDGIPYLDGAAFQGFSLEIADTGANGIRLWESRDVKISDFNIVGPAGIAGTCLELNGGDDASPTWGSAHNVIENGFIKLCAKGMRFYTDNTTTPASTTAFANRNWVFGVQVATNTIGLDMDRANTNSLNMSIQGNTEGLDLGAYAGHNRLDLELESNTRQIEFDPAADDNIFFGNCTSAMFVDGAGVAVDPHSTITAMCTNMVMLHQLITMPDGGSWRLLNPFATGPIRIRAGDTYDQDFCLGSHDSADTNFDLLCMKYDATAPYAAATQLLVQQISHTQVASTAATNVSYSTAGDIYRSTGATTINTVVAPTLGSPCISIIFTENVTVNDDGTSAGNLVLAGGANMSATANDVLNLCWATTLSKWLEMGRSVN